jgi:hypothetical protein
MIKYLVLLVLLLSCNFRKIPGAQFLLGPKFKVGDCINSPFVGEFSSKDYYRKILKVGKENYLYQYGEYVKNETSIRWTDLNSFKVSCEEAGF